MPTSHGERLLEAMLTRIIFGHPERNVRPPWLDGLELDFWYSGHRLAFEFQGGQHYAPVYGWRQLKITRANDMRKRTICKNAGITLIRVDAADLTYPRLVRMVRYWFAHGKRRKDLGRVLVRGRVTRAQCRQVGLAAVEYRRSIADRFECPTAHRKRSLARKRAMSSAG